VGIRVDQFAVGFGNAMFAWRKGIGFRLGNTQKDYRERAEKYLLSQRGQTQAIEQPEFSDEQIANAGDALGLGETEYRLNWIPLGGYVKMMGQDDLKPDAVAEDPRAYNKKSIPARMLVISAGVIMNVILAAIGFMILFTIGFKVPPAWVGNIVSNSPAQKAGLKVGDRIITFDGKPQEDFTKITLNTALVEESAPITMVVDRPDPLDPQTFHRVTLTVTPARRAQDTGFLAIGFEAPRMLKAPIIEPDEEADLAKARANLPPGVTALHSGDTIIAVNGHPVTPDDYALFDHFVQSSFGKPLALTIEGADHKIRPVVNDVHFGPDFNGSLDILGIVPRTRVDGFMDNSVVHADDRLHLDDVITSIRLNGDSFPNPTHEQVLEHVNAAGHQGKAFDITVLRDGKLVTVSDVKASIKVDRDHDRYGIGVQLSSEEQEAVIAGLLENSPFKAAGLINGDKIVSIDGEPVKSWFDVHRVLFNHPTDKPIQVEYVRENVSGPKQATLRLLTPEEVASVKNIRYIAEIQEGGLMAEKIVPRHAQNLAQAAKWGVTETRDFILQFYLTLRRMVDRSVSPANMMGPVGIFIGGKRFAYKGFDWLLWFLCMISANLAVVNFLPIPVVDGGQFMFLVLEKIKGKPLSPRSMAIAQYVGLAFLAALVLFVTYHDILRSFG
jgi:regulator of sigma E protease